MAANSPIRSSQDFFTGEDKTVPFAVQNTSRQPQNITGWAIQFKLEQSQGGAVLVTKTATITSGVGGTCAVALLASDTSGLSPGTYWYVLARTDAGLNTVLAYGEVVLKAR